MALEVGEEAAESVDDEGKSKLKLESMLWESESAQVRQ